MPKKLVFLKFDFEILKNVDQFQGHYFDKISLNAAGCQIADNIVSVHFSIESELKGLKNTL